jgi:hypothetical protein
MTPERDTPQKRKEKPMPCRRQFLAAIPVAVVTGFAVTASLTSGPAVAAMLAEDEPAAKKLGYKADAAAVDKTAFPTYTAAQTCANCQLYQGDKGSPSGGCILFGNNDVAAKGWCSAWEQG